MAVEGPQYRSVEAYSARQPGLLDPLLSLLFGLLIWLPFQVWNMFNPRSWRMLAKQIRYGSLLWEPVPPVSASPAPCNGVAGVAPLSTGVSLRSLSTQQLSQFMELTRADHTSGLDPSQPRRLTLLYTWLMAKPQHVKKYTKIFTDVGIDVLKVQISPMDLMQPTTRSQVAAQQVLDYLLANPQFDRLLVYGFSVGAYAFSESAKKIVESPERYASVRDRIVGHIWDSPVDVDNMPTGVAKSVTSNLNMQNFIIKYVDWFMKVRYEVATQYYVEASRVYSQAHFTRAPALYIYSRNDPMSPPSINEEVVRKWKASGMDVYKRVFERAPHCASYLKYPAEYDALLHDYLIEIGYLEEVDHRSLAQAVA